MSAKVSEFRVVRVHGAVTADAERRLLVWIAERLPARVNSDHLTFTGAAALIGVGACYWLGGAALAFVVPLLALNWFGDSLDGTLARVRNRQRPRYGYYVDHVLDLAGTTCLLAGMAASGRMSPLIAAAVLVGYLLVSAESYLATHAT